MAERLAVLGSPIAHSYSPALHDAAYRTLGLDWEYTAIELAPGALRAFIADRDDSWRGLSLTMPFKQEVLELLDDIDHVARLTGSANTVRFADADDTGRRPLSGFNTDVVGLVHALADTGVTSATHVSVLGGGSTARSALMAAAELGAESVDLFVRSALRAQPLVTLAASLGLMVTVRELSAAPGAADSCDLVISSLPGGTELDPALLVGAFPAPLRERVPLLDVAYAPWPSALASLWQSSGGTAHSGLGMLLHQALVQVRIFISHDPFEPLPNEPAVLAAMRAALPGEQPRQQPVGG